ETSVPYTKGSAPNFPATGSHAESTRNRQPKARIASRDSQASATTSPVVSRITIHTAARTTPSKTRSPERRRASPSGTGGRDIPLARPRPARRPGQPAPLLRREERLPRVGDLSDLRLDLLHHRLGQRSVEEGAGVLLPGVDGPPQELHQGLTLGLVGLVLVDE